MVYGSLNGIKEWLGIPSTNVEHDTELGNIQASVSREMDLVLKRYTSLPLQRELAEELGDIADQWCAGIFYSRRSPQEEHPFVKRAQLRFKRFLAARFKGSFVKVGRRAKKVRRAKRSSNGGGSSKKKEDGERGGARHG